MKPCALHHWMANGKRFQCKYCGVFKDETDLEGLLRQSIEQVKEAKNG